MKHKFILTSMKVMSFLLNLQIAKNYIKALNDMISWSDAKRSDFSHSELSPGLDFS